MPSWTLVPHLKKTVENPNRRSRHYTKQAAFEGSDRKIRGSILRMLLAEKHLTAKGDTIEKFTEDAGRVIRILKIWRMRDSSSVPVHGYRLPPADTGPIPRLKRYTAKDVTSTELIRGYYPYPLIDGCSYHGRSQLNTR